MKLHTDPVPLRVEEDGNIYVGSSRVVLDVVLDYYQQGLSPRGNCRRLQHNLFGGRVWRYSYYFRQPPR